MQFHVEIEPDPGSGRHGIVCMKSALNLEPVYSQKRVMANENAEKLDIVMTVLLDHLHSLCHMDGVCVCVCVRACVRMWHMSCAITVFDEPLLHYTGVLLIDTAGNLLKSLFKVLYL